MEPNHELRLAWEYAEHTGVSIFLTGKAGTGKTTFLRTLRQRSSKSIVVVAPTGVAAINAGGVTIHSFFQLPTAPYVPGSDYKDKFNFSRQKLRIIRALDLLVIDEISMVRADLLDAIDHALKKYRRNTAPFGGVQLLMIGDLRQLAPVVTPADEALLAPHYSTNYFFGSKALAQIPYVTIALTRVYRQQNERFVALLNHVRDNCMDANDISMLQSRLNPDFRPDSSKGYIRLTTHNATADDFNQAELARIPGTSRLYRAAIKGTFPEYAYPTSPELHLKVGAQVMFVKNDPSADHLYYNGKIGIVTAINAESVTVQCDDSTSPIVVMAQEWDNPKYTINETTGQVITESQGSFTQIPLRLAWAITIHKSQGLTFDRVIIDAGRSFAPGQVYVALSRCRSLEGIVLSTPIGTTRLGSDPEVTNYIVHQDIEAQRSFAALSDIKEAFFRNQLLDLFNFAEIVSAQQSVARIMAQTFRHMFALDTAAQATISIRLREKVVEVADKWIVALTNAPASDLHSPSATNRVKSAANYFGAQLAEIFGSSLTVLARVKSNDKKASERIRELTSDLATSLKAKIFVLKHVADHGFELHDYQRVRRQALLQATAEPAKTTKTTAKKTARKAGATPTGYASSKSSPSTKSNSTARHSSWVEAEMAYRARQIAKPTSDTNSTDNLPY